MTIARQIDLFYFLITIKIINFIKNKINTGYLLESQFMLFYKVISMPLSFINTNISDRKNNTNRNYLVNMID